MASILIRSLTSRFSTFWTNGVGVLDPQPRRFIREMAKLLHEGQSVVLDGRFSTILKATHQQGTAGQEDTVELELRDLREQWTFTKQLRSSEEIERAYLSTQTYKVMYVTHDGKVGLEHPLTYESTTVPAFIFSDLRDYLRDDMIVEIVSNAWDPVFGRVAVTDTVKVKYVSGDINFHGLREAVLQNGLTIRVPGDVKSGDWVDINANDHQFVKRYS